MLLRATGSDAAYQQTLVEQGIDDLVQLAPPVGYRDALHEMLNADGLLLFQAAICNHQIPAKLYEYLRAGRPVLTLTDHAGDTAAAMREVGAADIVDIADKQDIARGLRRFVEGLRQGRLAGVPRSVADRNSRRARTSELAALLDEVSVPK